MTFGNFHRRAASVVALMALAATVFWWSDEPIERLAPQRSGASGAAVAAFDDWREWAGRQLRVDLDEGIKLARERTAMLEELARQNPTAARARLMGLSELAALPPAVRRECEIPWSGMADFELRWETDVDASGQLRCRHHHVVIADGFSAEAFGPHLREATRPLAQVLLQGHRIGGILLLDEAPARLLTGEDAAAAERWFPVADPLVDPSTGVDARHGVRAVVAGMVRHFESMETLSTVQKALEDAVETARRDERRVAPNPFPMLAASGGPGGGPGGPAEPAPGVGDAIDVLFIRVDFSDFAGEVNSIGKAALDITLEQVASSIQQYSYGKASLNCTVSQKLYRLPASGSSYAVAGNNNGIRDAARALAAADHDLERYDVVAVYFPSLAGVAGSKITYKGLGGVGYGEQWINGNNDPAVIAHEFGHNYGLLHANYWNPSKSLGGERFDDPLLGSLEYGDVFDLMGQGTLLDGYFSPLAAHKLGWLPEEKILTPASGGTFRIHRFDAPGAIANPVLAVRVPMGNGVNYWVAHRKRYGSPSNLANAAYVVAEGLYPGRPNLIDMTPGSNSNPLQDRRDCGLAVGGVLNDPAAGVRFETVASGGTAPNEWIDVRLQFDPRISVVESVVEVGERDGVARVTLRRNFGNGTPASVNYATANGSASAGADYLALSGTVTWEMDDFSDKVLAIPVRPDSLNEGVETFTFTLSSPTGGLLSAGATSTTIRILDPGRQYNGFAPGFFNTTVEAIIALPDGKVIIGGNIGEGISNTPGIRHIARLNADGSVDPDFLTGLGFNAPVREILRQPDGKLLVAGDFTSYDGTPCNRLIRLNSNGTAETAFVAAYGNGPNAAIRSLALDRDGNILVAGDFTTFSGQSVKRLVRLLPNGARDTITPLVVDAALSVTWLDAVIALPNGKILIGGALNHASYVAPPVDGFRSGVARLERNGSRDATFEVGAGAHIGPRNTLGSVSAMAVQPDGKLVVGGTFTSWNGAAASRLARLNENGTRDASFTAPAFNQPPLTLRVQPSGTVLVGGFFTTPVPNLARLTAAGAMDPGWNPGGQPSALVLTVVEDLDGGVLLGGNFFEYAGVPTNPLVRVAGGGGDAFDVWKVAQFSAAQLLSGAAAPGADPDGDGFSNLLEMAAGSSPTVAGSAPAGSGVTAVTSGGQSYLQLEFLKGPGAGSLWIGGQFSENGVGWSPPSPAPGSNATYRVIEDSPTRLILRDNTPASSAPRRFGRIHVKRPE